jgi:hypothetical protein
MFQSSFLYFSINILCYLKKSMPLRKQTENFCSVFRDTVRDRDTDRDVDMDMDRDTDKDRETDRDRIRGAGRDRDRDTANFNMEHY